MDILLNTFLLIYISIINTFLYLKIKKGNPIF